MRKKKYFIKKILTGVLFVLVALTSVNAPIAYADHDCLTDAQKTAAGSAFNIDFHERACNQRYQKLSNEYKGAFKCTNTDKERLILTRNQNPLGVTRANGREVVDDSKLQAFIAGKDEQCRLNKKKKENSAKLEADAELLRQQREQVAKNAAKKGYVPLQSLPGITTTGPEGGVKLPEYLAGMFKLGIGMATVLAVLMLVVAGMQYIGGASSPNARSEAHKRIISAITGLFIAIGSFLLLNTIDTNLVGTTVTIPTVDTGASSVQGTVTGIDGLDSSNTPKPGTGDDDDSDGTNPTTPSGGGDDNIGTNPPGGGVPGATAADDIKSADDIGITLNIDPGHKGPTISNDRGNNGLIWRDSADNACKLGSSNGVIRLKYALCNQKNKNKTAYLFEDELGKKETNIEPAPVISIEDLRKQIVVLVKRIRESVLDSITGKRKKESINTDIEKLEKQINTAVTVEDLGGSFNDAMIEGNKAKDMRDALLSAAKAIPLNRDTECRLSKNSDGALCMANGCPTGFSLVPKEESFTCGGNTKCCEL